MDMVVIIIMVVIASRIIILFKQIREIATKAMVKFKLNRKRHKIVRSRFVDNPNRKIQEKRKTNGVNSNKVMLRMVTELHRVMVKAKTSLNHML